MSKLLIGLFIEKWRLGVTHIATRTNVPNLWVSFSSWKETASFYKVANNPHAYVVITSQGEQQEVLFLFIFYSLSDCW